MSEERIITAVVGVIALGAYIEGYMIRDLNPIFRLLMFALAIMLMMPGISTDLIGRVIFLAIVFIMRRKSRGEIVIQT